MLRLLLLIVACTASMAGAQHPPAEPVRLRLVAEREALVPGEVNWLGVRFEMSEGWHIYWKGQNDTGAPPEVRTRLPAGYAAGELRWPAPGRHLSPGPLLDYVYEDRVMLLMPLMVPADAPPGKPVTVSIEADWMVCREACILSAGTASLELPVVEPGAKPAPSKEARLFEAARERLPVKGDGVATEWKGSTLVVTAAGATKLAFYPMEGSADLENAIEDGESEGETLSLRVARPGRVFGVLEVWRGGVTSRPTLRVLDVQPATGR